MSPHHMFVTCRTSHCGHCIKRKENHLAEIWLDQFTKREVGFGPVGQWAWRQRKERQCLHSIGPDRDQWPRKVPKKARFASQAPKFTNVNFELCTDALVSCIFAAEWCSLLVNFSTAWDGIVMCSRYFEQFGILVQITIKKSPNLLQNMSRKSPDSTWKSFFPYYNRFQHKVPMAKFCSTSTESTWYMLIIL